MIGIIFCTRDNIQYLRCPLGKRSIGKLCLQMRQYLMFSLSGTGESGASISRNASNIVHIQKNCICRQSELQRKDARSKLDVDKKKKVETDFLLQFSASRGQNSVHNYTAVYTLRNNMLSVSENKFCNANPIACCCMIVFALYCTSLVNSCKQIM